MAGAPGERTIGSLVSDASAGLSTLVRQEVELAKAEIKQEVGHVGKGVGMFGAAGFAGYLALLFLSLGAALGIGTAIGYWAGALIVGGVYLLAALVLAIGGKKQMSGFDPVPHRTLETVKADVATIKSRGRG
jgi:hypothetical protein